MRNTSHKKTIAAPVAKNIDRLVATRIIKKLSKRSQSLAIIAAREFANDETSTWTTETANNLTQLTGERAGTHIQPKIIITYLHGSFMMSDYKCFKAQKMTNTARLVIKTLLRDNPTSELLVEAQQLSSWTTERSEDIPGDMVQARGVDINGDDVTYAIHDFNSPYRVCSIRRYADFTWRLPGTDTSEALRCGRQKIEMPVFPF